jgi:type III secretion protein Q
VPLPFDLPVISRGFAALTPAASAVGVRALEAAAAAVAEVVGREISIRARPAPGVATPRPAVARVALELTALPAAAVLEVEPAMVVACVDLLAGGSGNATGATALTPVEAAALELFALAALDGACSVSEIDGALAPRLSRSTAEPASALAIELDVVAGPIAGRGRLLVPAAAVRGLRGSSVEAGRVPAVPIPLSVRSGRASLGADELGALSPRDVVLLDPPGDASDALVMPGGARFSGRLDDVSFHVNEVTMTGRNAHLPVVLEVELARVEVSLADIARLEPGSALPLGIDRRGLVTLRVGERAVARGELVDVEGAVGVRILSVEVGS